MDARSFRSAYTLQQHHDVLDPFGEYLTWTEAVIGDGRHTTTFYLGTPSTASATWSARSHIDQIWSTHVTGAPYREVTSKVATAPNNQSRR